MTSCAANPHETRVAAEYDGVEHTAADARDGSTIDPFRHVPRSVDVRVASEPEATVRTDPKRIEVTCCLTQHSAVRKASGDVAYGLR